MGNISGKRGKRLQMDIRQNRYSAGGTYQDKWKEHDHGTAAQGVTASPVDRIRKKNGKKEKRW